MKKLNLFKGVYNWSFLLIIVGAIVLLNIIGAFVYGRYDATSDKRYSLSEGTIAYLENEENFADRISIKIYLAGNLPAEIQRFKKAIEDKLKEFKMHAGSRIEYTFVDPLQGSDSDREYVQEALYNKGKGIIPMGLIYMKDGAQNNLMLWPGAEMDYAGSTVNSIQFLPGTPQGKFYTLNSQLDAIIQNSINNLEYMLISAIRRSTQQKKPRIAFLQGHGELTAGETQRVRALIAPYYGTENITINDSIDALKGVAGLVIARPTRPFSEKDKFIIDQFVMNGGRLMCFIDKLEFQEDTLNKVGLAHTSRTNLDLDRMLFDYGIKVNDNYVVDVRCAPKLVPQSKNGFLPWYLYVRSTPAAHPIARNIEPVLLKYASEIQFVGNNSNVVSPILTTSTNSAVTGLAPLISLGMTQNYGDNPKLAPDPTAESNKICVAGLVEGRFKSHYKNRIVDTYTNNENSNYKDSSVAEGKVLVVGNGSFLKNAYDSVFTQIQGRYTYIPNPFNELKFDQVAVQIPGAPNLIYGNQEFFQNMVDYMTGDNSVLDLRSKQIDIRPIDKEKVKENASFYKVINMVLPSLIVLLFAGVMMYIRRKKYTKN